MKKFLYLLLVLPLVGLLAACSKDDAKDLPEVSLSLDYSGAASVNGELYAIQGDTVTIENLTVTPLPGAKKATLGEVTYGFDGVPFFRSIVSPYATKILTADLKPGQYLLTVVATVFQVDKEVAFATFTYPLNIVGMAEDIPAGGQLSHTVTPDFQLATVK